MVPKKAPLAIIRSDGSVRIGGGHIVRCLALAEELAARDWSVVFCSTQDTFDLMPHLPGASECAGVIAFDGGDIGRMKQRWPEGATLLVIDHYGLDFSFESAAQDFANVVLAIDDFPTRQHRADILVDTTLARQAAEYADVHSGVALCGADYAMLRQPFRDARAESQRKGLLDHSELRALVSFGLTDPDDATGFALEAIKGVIANVDIVLGERAPHRARLMAMAERTPGWRFHTQLSAAGMATLLVASDLVFGAAGSSAYERCCLGKPTLLLQTFNNQTGNSAALVAAGAARLVGVFGEASTDEVRRLVVATCQDRLGLARMGESAASLVDGNGVKRVVDAVETVLSTL